MLVRKKQRRIFDSRPFYADLYRKAWDNDDQMLDPDGLFGNFVELLPKRKNSRALDIGCGLGRHSVSLARRGFEVEALDRDSFAVDYLNRYAQRNTLAIQANVGDGLRVDFGLYRMVTSMYVLDEASKGKSDWLIRRMQNATAIGGYNFIAVYTHGTSRSFSRTKDGHHLYSPREMNALYSEQDGWNMLLNTVATQGTHQKPFRILYCITCKGVPEVLCSQFNGGIMIASAPS
jgi:SAM-dependent methyltransferase